MIQWLRKVSLFDGLTDEQLEHVLRIATKRSIPVGTVLFHEKEYGDKFYVILSGSIKIYSRSANGEEKVLTVMADGESFGELALLDGRPRSASAQTLETTLVLEISSDNFLELLRNHFDITQSILKELSKRLRVTNEHVNDLTFLDERTRIVKNLILLANKHGRREGSSISIRVALNRDELSQMAGVTKSVLNEVLLELEYKGVLRISPLEYVLHLDKLRT
ncbi:Crp/Fnr family transcriptional regulator [Cohnella thailandensis]|uniref:Crp/Fnr family transcriptional regulator n=1 Tax=Cohnella thailandensis TaxID=557557 RepID=A0A841SW92_9BACL|nr:Crp/Fnr family transcriptional regulator [Cohnella thailandensis]MBB6633897.1 Crp/Fnr family transcriptional regulator [Cohnella thailandensis]MBP1972580.1 CRP-like cAMP-binding protein [Cohnella thailandensis]